VGVGGLVMRAWGLRRRTFRYFSPGAPMLLRLAWADAGTYDKARAPLGWPHAGGCVGSVRTLHALQAPPNAGLMAGVSTYLSPIKEACPEVRGVVVRTGISVRARALALAFRENPLDAEPSRARLGLRACR
jgi:hypothetical protein